MNATKLILSTISVIAATTVIMLSGCSSDSAPAAVAPAPPPAPPDVLIKAHGGSGGDEGLGGNGSEIIIMKHTGSGPVEIRREGSVDASFSPFMPGANLGSNPAIVSVDATIEVVLLAGLEPGAGTLYFQEGLATLFKSDGDTIPFNPEEIVTGLHIEQDVVLTLNLNFLTSANISLRNDLLNQGTIQTADVDDIDRGGLSINVSSYFANSEIDASGQMEGQNGGIVNISVGFSIVNHGGINTSGADNSNGDAGNAGSIDLNAGRFSIENTGILDAAGGTSSTASGGSAGSVNISSGTGIRNSGDLLARGGDGISLAGAGLPINLNVIQAGNILNAGKLDTRGGSATQANGGGGGPIFLNTRGGYLVSSGELISRGGDTQLSGSLATGGSGGPVELNIQGIGSTTLGISAPGNLQVSGNIDTSGGNAPAVGDGSGGSAGRVQFFHSATGSVPDDSQTITLLGYALIDSSGGDGQSGGSGLPVRIENMPISSDANGRRIPSGNIINEAVIDTSGGDVSATAVGSFTGGCHGEVRFDTSPDLINQASPQGAGIDNSGAITARKGESLETGVLPLCSSVGFFFQAYSGITNTAALDASGGNDRGSDGAGPTGIGTDASSIEMRAIDGPIINSGTLTARGGNGEFTAGRSIRVAMAASSVDNSADIDASGGDANLAVLGSTGGNGGFVDLFGSNGLGSVVNTATVKIDGGTGETPGIIGSHIEDGFCIAGNC